MVSQPAWDTPAGECGDEHGGYRCNRVVGHAGDHVYRQPYASWPNDADREARTASSQQEDL